MNYFRYNIVVAAYPVFVYVVSRANFNKFQHILGRNLRKSNNLITLNKESYTKGQRFERKPDTSNIQNIFIS